MLRHVGAFYRSGDAVAVHCSPLLALSVKETPSLAKVTGAGSPRCRNFWWLSEIRRNLSQTHRVVFLNCPQRVSIALKCGDVSLFICRDLERSADQFISYYSLTLPRTHCFWSKVYKSFPQSLPM